MENRGKNNHECYWGFFDKVIDLTIDKVIDRPFLWDMSRVVLDMTCGLYKKRIKFIKDLGLLKDNPGVLDLGCGTGQCANVTDGPYVGIDLNQACINYAAKKKYKTKKTFLCVDLTTAWKERERFDIVLIVDLLHHISDRECIDMLKTASEITEKYLINYEPIIGENTTFFDRWLMKHDGGEYFRSADELNQLFQKAGYKIIKNEDVRLAWITSHLTICCPDRNKLSCFPHFQKKI